MDVEAYRCEACSELTIEIARDKVAESGVPRVCIMLPCDPLGLIISSKREIIKNAIEVDERFHRREEDPVIKTIEEGLRRVIQNSNTSAAEKNRNEETEIETESEEVAEDSSDLMAPDERDILEDAEVSPVQVSAVEELNALIGLTEVKQKVKTLVNVLQVRKRCQQLNIKRPAIGHHMVFLGNPGTGKTTVARILGKIYKEAGLLSQGHIVEVGRVDLEGKYVGHTAAMVKDVFEQARGGILFIDEAYSLTSEDGQGGYGKEAVETLLKLMEDNRDDIAVIAAGYPALMQEFLDSNPGFRSRFPFVIQFPDYSGTELTEIFKGFCRDNDIKPSRSIIRAVRNHFELEASKKVRNYGNARAVRNYFEQMIMNQANRLAETGCYEKEDLCRISMTDLPKRKLFMSSPAQYSLFSVRGAK